MSRQVERLHEPRRLLALGLVAVVLALGGVANATFRPSDRTAVAATASAVSASVATSGASSTAWYCPGPLPVGAGKDASSIAVANLGARTVHGELLVSSTASGTRSTTSIAVGPSAESVFGLTRSGSRGDAAVTVLVDGSGIGVEELVHGPTGVTASPCTNSTASLEYLASGSTLGANNLGLSIFDPGATPAVVDVTFATSTGPVAPPAFQGLAVPAGKVVVLDVGHEVPSRAVVSTTVRSTGGRVVVGTAVVAPIHHAVLSSLATAVPAPSRSWIFPGGPAGSSTTDTFDVFNPGDRPARVQLRLAAGASTSVLTAAVPPHGVIALTPGGSAGAEAFRWASLVATGAPVVAGREAVVPERVVSEATLRLEHEQAVASEAAKRAAKIAQAARERAARAAAAKLAKARAGSKARHGRGAPTTTTTTTQPASPPTVSTVPVATLAALPALEPGLAVTSGVAVPERSWVLPGGESDATTSEVVVVANTTSSVAHLQLDELGAGPGSPSTPTPLASLPTLTVGPGEILPIDLGKVVGTVPALPILVTSDRRVVVGQLLYERKPTGTGFTLATAIPVH